MKKKLLAVLTAVFVLSCPVVFSDDKKPADKDPLNEAKELFNPDNFKQAIEKYKKLAAQKDYENNVDVHNNLGVLYFEIHDYDNAAKSFSKVAELDPSRARTYYYLGLCYEAMSVDMDSRTEKVMLRRQALKHWQDFVKYSNELDKKLDADNIESAQDQEKKSIDRANRHIKFLTRYLNDKK